MDIESTLKFLHTFKNLPTYQFERRIDAFLLPYLETVFNKHFDTDDFKFLYPEFPIFRMDEKKMELIKDNSPVYADYLMWSKKIDNTLFLVELKTDKETTGKSKNQLIRYLLNCREGWSELLTNYFKKSLFNKDPYSRGKYIFGLKHLLDVAPGIPESIKLIDFDSIHRSDISERSEKFFSIKNILQKENKSKLNLKTIFIGPFSEKDIIADMEIVPVLKEYLCKSISLSEFAFQMKYPLSELLIKIDNE